MHFFIYLLFSAAIINFPQLASATLNLPGSGYMYRYAVRRFRTFQEQEALDCLDYARRQHHFDSNQRTCNMTVLSMLPTLRERLVQLLNTEQLTEQLKGSPCNKLQIWEDLKILSITRTVSVVYACTMMCMLLRVQLNIIGGYMFIDNMLHKSTKKSSKGSDYHVTPSEVQEKYLSLIRDFFNKGLCDLVNNVKDAVVKETSSLSLKERLSMQNVEAVIKHVRERVENGHESTLQEIPTLPLSKYLIDCDDRYGNVTEDLYVKLLQETQDILESYDYNNVFEMGLNRGFARMMDFIAEHYKHAQKQDSSIQHFHEVAVPIAKLIPFINSLMFRLGSDAPNPLVQELLLLEQTKTLAANIYEAFSQCDDQVDAQFSR